MIYEASKLEDMTEVLKAIENLLKVSEMNLEAADKNLKASEYMRLISQRGMMA